MKLTIDRAMIIGESPSRPGLEAFDPLTGAGGRLARVLWTLVDCVGSVSVDTEDL